MLGRLFQQPLAPGTEAPDFTLPDDSGRPTSLAALRGRPVVLIFYPGDNTPVCSRQLCEFRDDWERLQAVEAAVVGISPQDEQSHRGFREKRRLPFPLLVDKGQRVAAAYHARGLIVRRTVYLIGPDGRIIRAWRGRPSPVEVVEACGIALRRGLP